MLSLRNGSSITEAMRRGARQEEWVLYTYAAKALGTDPITLYDLPEPRRSFWKYRGLLLNKAESLAFQQDQLDAKLDASAESHAAGL